MSTIIGLVSTFRLPLQEGALKSKREAKARRIGPVSYTHLRAHET